MPQRYKLRLSDGTFLSVDLEGLRAWVDDKGAVAQSVGSQQWRPLRDVLVDEESALRLLKALVPPQPRQPATPAPEPSAPEPPEPAALVEPPALFGEAPRAFSAPAPTFIEPASAFARAASEWSEPSSSPREPAPTFSEPAPAFSEPAPAPSRPASAWTGFNPPVSEPRLEIGAPPDLQVLADEPVSSGSEGSPASADFDDAMPAIRMKPLDDEQRFRSAWDEGGEAEQEEEDEEPHQDRLEGPLLTLLETFGGLLSRVLDRLAPLVSGVRFDRTREQAPPDESAPDVAVAPVPAASRGRASILSVAEDPALPPESEWPAEPADQPSLYARASGWLRGLRAHETPSEEEEQQPTPEPAPRQARPQPIRPREPVAMPPPAVTELPVVPFAPSREVPERMTVYEGPDEPFVSFSLGPIWFWTKRVVVLGAAFALAAYAVLERDTWFPKAADLGQTVFTEVDHQVLARQRGAQQQQALAAASERLPQLAPETIRLFFGRSPLGVAEAPEVFELARAAADRGRVTLAPAEAEELLALERELAGRLRPVERELVREYDRNRARRPIFPFENPNVMELVAQGARLLAPERRARLQALTHAAVVAGVDLPESPPAPSATR